MIARWLARRRDLAADAWRIAERVAWGNPLSLARHRDATYARRRFNRWDRLLDLWTLGGRV